LFRHHCCAGTTRDQEGCLILHRLPCEIEKMEKVAAGIDWAVKVMGGAGANESAELRRLWGGVVQSMTFRSRYRGKGSNARLHWRAGGESRVIGRVGCVISMTAARWLGKAICSASAIMVSDSRRSCRPGGRDWLGLGGGGLG
jgi:hypothetical protein